MPTKVANDLSPSNKSYRRQVKTKSQLSTRNLARTGESLEEEMTRNADYADLLNRFMLQRRPYIQIALTLDQIYHNLQRVTNLNSSAIAPLDFTLLKSLPDHEYFRWILGFDQQKFRNILENKELFCEYANVIYGNIGRYPHLAAYYKQVLEKPDTHDDVEFLTAVFHLTYRFVIPENVFNVGLVHREHNRRDADYYKARLCIDAEYDDAGLPPIEIEELPAQPQISQETYRRQYDLFHPFLKKWIETIQGLGKSDTYYKHIHHVYFPVYDGLLKGQRSLRGYLGVFCIDEESREAVLDYFKSCNFTEFKDINEAYKRGIHHNIVDSFKIEYSDDPVAYWIDSFDDLHQWGNIQLSTPEATSNKALLWIEGRYCNISVERLLDRRSIAGYVEDFLRAKYKGSVLSLNVPSSIISPGELTSYSPFLRQRIREITQLLDELLRTRFIMQNEKRVRRAAVSSAVTAVMSRNMSHNLGSHVIARLCAETEFPGKNDERVFKKIATFNSFLRTRMDFLADQSTATPAVMTSMRLYRDCLGYFKPTRRNQNRIGWQEVLLDYISGIDDLNAQNIIIHLKRNGEDVDLDTPELDPIFACPNGLLGTHALYIIIENIIRNSAKHAYDHNTHERLEITLEINEGTRDDNLIEIVIHDNLGNAAMQLSHKNKIGLIDYLNEKIDESILNASGALRGVAWGVLEMKICAAYLRKISSKRLDDKQTPSLLRAIAVGENLGYRFYLRRQPEILIVDDGQLLLGKKLDSVLKEYGITQATSSEFRNMVQSNIEHRFVLLVQPDEALLKFVKENRQALPVRVLATECRPDEFPLVEFEPLQQCFIDVSDLGTTLTNLLWQSWKRQRNASLFVRLEEPEIAAKWSFDTLSYASARPQDIASLDKNRKYVIYDRHGYIAKNHAALLQQQDDAGRVLYYENIQSDQPTHFIINYVPDDRRLNRMLAYELLEAGLVKVVLLDERIQKATEETYSGDKRLTDLLEKMNVWSIRRDEIDLDNPNRKISCDALMSWLETHLKDATFLGVHLGILEKIFKDDVRLMGRKIKDLESKFPNLTIILISGRGLPDAIRRLETRFIQYSQVARYLLEERSKYHLTKVLFAARRHIP